MEQSNRTRPTLLLVRAYNEHDEKWAKRVERVAKALNNDVEIVLVNKKESK